MPEMHKTTTVIGPDTHIKGEMVFDSTARILGTFEGRVIAKGEVQIGEGAACKAAVEGQTVIVDGLIEGDVHARERVQLNAKARVVGDIVAATLVVAEGACFTGHCRVGSDAARQVKNGQPEQARRPQQNNGPVVSSKPTELEQTLAGLEARLTGARRPAEIGYTNGTDSGL
jgi:cytoskeletal protein CcmA (bactofilin family)